MVPALIIVLLFAAPVWGQEKMKIGFVDLKKAISLSRAGKVAKEKFQAQIKKVEADLKKEQQELERLRADIDKKGLLLDEEQKSNLEREFQKRYRDYQRNMRDNQQELREREREAMNKIIIGIEKATDEIGKEENFTLILTRNQLLYVDQGVDITQKVVELYDRRIGGGAAKKK